MVSTPIMWELGGSGGGSIVGSDWGMGTIGVGKGNFGTGANRSIDIGSTNSIGNDGTDDIGMHGTRIGIGGANADGVDNAGACIGMRGTHIDQGGTTMEIGFGGTHNIGKVDGNGGASGVGKGCTGDTGMHDTRTGNGGVGIDGIQDRL